MKLGWNRMMIALAGVLMAASAVAGDPPDSDTAARRTAPAKAEPPGAATLSEPFPFRYVGLSGTGRKPEFIALTDGTHSFVAKAGDVIGERYRITELRASDFVLTDLKSGNKGIVVSYKDIQPSPSELTSEDAPEAAPRVQTEAIPVAERSARGTPAEPAPAANPEATHDEDIPDHDTSTMIAPPPVNRAEQALPMEIMPPPERNPMIVTTPVQDVPMITTPSRREHQEPLDIPLGPQ